MSDSDRLLVPYIINKYDDSKNMVFEKETFLNNLKAIEQLELVPSENMSQSSYIADVKTSDELIVLFVDGERQTLADDYYVSLNSTNSDYYSINFSSLLSLTN